MPSTFACPRNKHSCCSVGGTGDPTRAQWKEEEEGERP